MQTNCDDEMSRTPKSNPRSDRIHSEIQESAKNRCERLASGEDHLNDLRWLRFFSIDIKTFCSSQKQTQNWFSRFCFLLSAFSPASLRTFVAECCDLKTKRITVEKALRSVPARRNASGIALGGGCTRLRAPQRQYKYLKCNLGTLNESQHFSTRKYVGYDRIPVQTPVK